MLRLPRTYHCPIVAAVKRSKISLSKLFATPGVYYGALQGYDKHRAGSMLQII